MTLRWFDICFSSLDSFKCFSCTVYPIGLYYILLELVLGKLQNCTILFDYVLSMSAAYEKNKMEKKQHYSTICTAK